MFAKRSLSTIGAGFASCALLAFYLLSHSSEGGEQFSPAFVEKKFTHYYEQWLDQIKSESVYDDTTHLWLTDIKESFVNVVTFSSYKNDDDARLKIAEVKKRATARQVPLIWWITPSTQPSSLGNLLLEEGFIHIGVFPIMLHTLERSAAPEGNSSVQIRRLMDESGIPQWTEILGKSFEYSPSYVATYEKMVQYALNTGAVEHYGGNLDDTLTTTGSLSINDGLYGCIYDISTDKNSRKRGMATAMSSHLLDRARQLKLQCVALMSFPEAQSIYDELGFKRMYDIAMYLLPCDQDEQDRKDEL